MLNNKIMLLRVGVKVMRYSENKVIRAL